MADNNAVMTAKWWTNETLAVVTGASEGIGYEIVRQLAENGLTVVLTARDVDRGLKATKTLRDQGLLNVIFYQLDIQSHDSVSDFAKWLENNYGGLDILVNNAAIFGVITDREAAIYAARASEMKDDIFHCPLFAKAYKTSFEMSTNCIDTNYYGTKRVTEKLLHLFKSSPAGARIVNVSSVAGLLKNLRIDSLRRQISDVSNLTEESIDMMIHRFLDDMKSGELEKKGWPCLAPHYCVSKLALNAYARLLHRKFGNNEKGIRIYVNSVHPGFVQSKMSDYLGELTTAQGAESCVRVALMGPTPDGPSGEFYLMKVPHPF